MKTKLLLCVLLFISLLFSCGKDDNSEIVYPCDSIPIPTITSEIILGNWSVFSDDTLRGELLARTNPDRFNQKNSPMLASGAK